MELTVDHTQCQGKYYYKSPGEVAEVCPLKYFVGLDLGQKQDYTALCVLERHGTGRETEFHCRHLQRFKLGTSYPLIVADVRNLCMREPLLTKKPHLAIDATGVGNAVVDIFKYAKPSINAYITPITIHGGNEVTSDGNGRRVPKRELVSVTQAALQTEHLKIAADLSEVGVLTTELQSFQVSISETGFDSYNARTGAHDDLVLSVAMALWLGHNHFEWTVRQGIW